jgi:DNA-binding transcriptional MerR regulator
MVGMSPRNIRAHQARKLLAPPVRQGRTCYYHAGHVRRLESIKALQRQGFNLVAISAILGSGVSDGSAAALVAMLQRLSVEHPHAVHALTRHGVIVRGEDGAIRMVHARLLRSALDLHVAGMTARPTMQLLVEVLDLVRMHADELVRATSARILALAPEAHRGQSQELTSWEELDRDAVALTQGLTVLLTEAFRVAVERSGQVLVPELVAGRAAAAFDNG